MSTTPRMRPGERPGTLRASRPNFRHRHRGVASCWWRSATAAIYALEVVAPVVSLSVVYLPAVLLVSAYWGLALGLATSLLSAAAFNFFHLPPDRPVHDRRQPQLGRAGGVHGRAAVR